MLFWHIIGTVMLIYCVNCGLIYVMFAQKWHSYACEFGSYMSICYLFTQMAYLCLIYCAYLDLIIWVRSPPFCLTYVILAHKWHSCVTGRCRIQSSVVDIEAEFIVKCREWFSLREERCHSGITICPLYF